AERLLIPDRHKEDHIQAKPWYQRLSQDYYYPGMYEDLFKVVRSCPTCQKMMAFPTGTNWIQNLPYGPGQELQLDHCGPFLDKQDNKFWILTIVDRFSNKLWATTVPSTSIPDVLVYLHEVVFSTFLPAKLHGDRAFTNSTLMKEFCDSFGISLVGGAT